MSFTRTVCSLFFIALCATPSIGCSSSNDDGGSAQSQASLCASSCQKGAQVCGAGFDEKSCEQQCDASPSNPSSAKVPDACKPQLEAYAHCAQSAKLVCPDGHTPQVQGCDAEIGALGQCMAHNPTPSSDSGTTYDDDAGSFDPDAW